MGPILGLLGAAMVLVGSLMPWATVTTAFGSITASGTDGDGQMTLVIGVILIVLIAGKLASSGKASLLNILIVLAALAALAIAGYDISNVQEAVDAAAPFGSASVGAGLYVVALGAILSFFGASGGGTQQNAADTRECPFCRERVHVDATVCPHCRRDLAAPMAPSPPQ